MRRCVLALAAVFVVSLTACPAPPPSPNAGDGDTSVQPKLGEDQSFAADAHEKAVQSLLPLAETALIADDPVAASMLGKIPLRPRAVGLVGLGERREALEPALAEANGIDESALESGRVIVLRAVRFGLFRMNNRLQRRPLEQNDPTVFYAEVDSFLDEVEYRFAHGSCDECVSAFEQLGVQWLNAPEYSAVSTASARAALDDLARIESRLARVPEQAPEAIGGELRSIIRGYTEAIAKRKTHLESVSASLPNAAPHSWDEAVAPIGRAAAIKRLPDALGGRELVRRVSVEEGVDLTPRALLEGVEQNLARYAGMAIGVPAPSDPARAVDVKRCQAEAEALERWAGTREEFSASEVSCEDFVRVHAVRPMSDSDLTLAWMDTAMIEPMRRKLRRAELPAIALIGGEWTPHTHFHLRRIMILMAGYDRPGAAHRAFARAREDLCLAGTALWLHGMLGDDSARTAWQGEHCSELVAEELDARALARPRRALRGLGLATLGNRPHEMVGLDRFYWAPLGNIPLLATPPGQHPDDPGPGAPNPAAGVGTVHVEQLEPAGAKP